MFLSVYFIGSNILVLFLFIIFGYFFISSKLLWKYGFIQMNDFQELFWIFYKVDIIGMLIIMFYKIIFMFLFDDLMLFVCVIGVVNIVFKRIDSEGKMRYIGVNIDCIGI